jgi:rfaE bifunctional protein nucleotidyltransferase chain/domain
MNPLAAPILSRTELISRVAAERAAGSVIILTNGCFDLIHAGHIRYLNGAKELGGFLIVGLNSDRQVEHLKGSGRPYISEIERAEIIASLRSVDAVTIFDEPTVNELIDDIRPDIHAKGTDYTIDSVPERERVRALGGRVAIVGDPKDHSSTDLIKTISRSS